ncbi:hypothetical protein FQN57_001753 [Myotisia sp. PD_48]|nr:hypothetical protein FQN57_001753 [Myotisia sp. PD_48]
MPQSTSPISPASNSVTVARVPSTTPCEDQDSSIKTSSQSPASTQPSTLDREKPRLSEKEKKSNHIASEQKRRAAIREGFDRLTELVPGLTGQGRSEGMVLRKTIEFMNLKLQERRELIEEIERRGGQVDGRIRNVVEDRMF